MTMGRRGDYGFDAPYALVTFAAVGAACAVVAIASLWRQHTGHLAATMGFYGAFFLGNALSFLHTTRRGKFQVWDEVLDELHLRGDERVLDMGCGRGAVLTAVARRLRTGRVTGIDLWSTHDQSGNARDVTLRNASLEGVQDRVDIETGDMRALPFPDATFDVVVSSLAIHNISSNAARALFMARSTSAAVEFGIRAITSPVAGLRTSSISPPASISRPSTKLPWISTSLAAGLAEIFKRLSL